MPWLGLAGVIVGGACVTVRASASIPIPPGLLTVTFLVPVAASAAIEILAVIWVVLLTVKVFTVIPAPKLTSVTLMKLVPLMVTDNVSP